MIIQTERLTKHYGKSRGIIDIDLGVRPTEVFGFLGPNGAGKSTTIRTLLDFIRPSAGRALIFGLDSHERVLEIHKRLGYLPGDLALYPKLTGEQNLRYFANLRGGVDWSFVRDLAERLDADLSKQVKNYSSGNRQKIGLIQAFMHKPELLILDEPTSGLDPLVQQEFYKMVQEVRANGQTVFLSSHNLHEVERVCDRVGIIREGKLIAVETVAEIKAKALRRLEIYFDGQVTASQFAGLPGIRNVANENSHLRFTVEGSLDALVKRAAEFTVINLVSEQPNLEEIFLTFYAKEGEHVQ
ncbi:MAG TPA: ABC transporter ATP-binding protein [Aggregatilinea sp.]|uniref:ABC transporter ATP-binding protein n=1 Tax=Aggregatilinea sp. TaxID=2806333 RepID=UPI002CE00F1A|nr:ABC transporter ATP-binding protein [Aggregatilinea sp.]HML22673.1 ABC transporter ATP-binding protein [Aggregatilinea sp.]